MSTLDMKPRPFTREIRGALADLTLQSALDANAERRLVGRRSALDALPDFPAMRQRAHDIRMHVIQNLEGYLERFVATVQANGIVVHRAADAHQAVEIVLQIAHQHAAGLLAKSKTMVSEEIELNRALQESGIRVVETDLGEYIVQLRGESPSHIITPAVHLQREDCGRTFQEKLGIPYTTDIPTLTRTARKVLRQVFLDADIGLSGVNFGVAETGTLCLVTNEGNGRMVTTLPPVHIALMGIERMLPVMDDLALMLTLLSRSATGQKITVYTNLINAPRRAADADGPSQRHLVLVDNGRSALRASPLAESLLCIRCGACLNACPVYREIGGHAYVDTSGHGSTYPGPIGSVISPGLFGNSQFGHLARASSLCGACKDACPVDIDLPEMLLRVRAGYSGEPGRSTRSAETLPNTPSALSFGLKVYTWLATSPRRFSLAQRLAGIIARMVSPLIGSLNAAGEIYLRLPAFTGWGFSKDLVRPASRTFHQRWDDIANAPPEEISPHSGFDRQSAAENLTPVVLTPTDHGTLVARFESELTALGGVFFSCESGELSARIAELLHQKGVDTLLAWGSDQLPQGLVETLQAEDFTIFPPDQPLPSDPAGIPAIGLTGALAGVAETGSLVLTAGAQRPLTTSLLPEVHIAVIRAQDILPTVRDALQLPELRASSSAVLVTGPSRTADIEMTLTIGVHGPGELCVFCTS